MAPCHTGRKCRSSWAREVKLAASGIESVPSKKLQSIQYLRAIAALMVAYFHLCLQVETYTASLTGPSWLGVTHFTAGVDIFFIISGFIMVATSQKLGPAAFLWRRLIRIVPLYWIATLVLVAAALLMPSAFKETSPNLTDTVKSLLFIAFHNAAQHGQVLPLLVPGWTLNLEMCFYAVFTLTLVATVRPYQIWIVAAVFSAVMLMGAVLWSGSAVFSFYAQPRIFEFWIGMVIGRVYIANRMAAPVFMAYGLLAIGLILTVTPLAYRSGSEIALMVGPALCVVGAICAERGGAMPDLPFLELLGDASYSIYLTHIFTLGVTRTVWRSLHSGASSAAIFGFAVFSMVAVVAVALLSYRYIEKPTLKWLLSLLERHRMLRSGAVGPSPG